MKRTVITLLVLLILVGAGLTGYRYLTPAKAVNLLLSPSSTAASAIPKRNVARLTPTMECNCRQTSRLPNFTPEKTA